MKFVTATLLLALVCCAPFAVADTGPTSRPTRKPPGKSTDGVPFPEVTCPVARATDAPAGGVKHNRLVDIHDLLLRAPGDLGLRIFNAEKSSQLLARRLSWKSDTEAVYSAGPNGGQEVDHGTVSHRGTLTPEWFALGIANCDVAGIWLHDGVIAKVSLFYHRGQDADADVRHSNVAVGGQGDWQVNQDEGATILTTDATGALEAIDRALVNHIEGGVKRDYDKFKDLTTFSTPAMEVPVTAGNGHFALMIVSTFSGQTVPRTPAAIDFTFMFVRYGHDWDWLKEQQSMELIVLADGKRLAYRVGHFDSDVGDYAGGHCRETAMFTVPAADLQAMLRAAKVEAQIGETEFPIQAGHLAKARELATALGVAPAAR